MNAKKLFESIDNERFEGKGGLLNNFTPYIELKTAMQWQPIETAPKGQYSASVRDLEWEEPPNILLKYGHIIVVGKWDWYYSPVGLGYVGEAAWIGGVSGELLSDYYGNPVAWMPLPE